VLHDSGRIDRVDPATGEYDVLAAGKRCRGIVVADRSVWTAATLSGTLIGFDPATGEPIGSVPLKGNPTALAEHDGIVWAGSESLFRHRGLLTAVDAASGETCLTSELPSAPNAITAGGGSIWVACSRRRGKRNGSILRVDPLTGEMTIALAETGWPVGQLAWSDGLLVATMSLATSHSCDGGAGGFFCDGGGGGGCGDGGGGGHGGGHC
jgi:outer membrane protein assembly factor BamB